MMFLNTSKPERGNSVNRREFSKPPIASSEAPSMPIRFEHRED